MKCKKCNSNKRLNEIFKSVTNYKEILEDRMTNEEKYEYLNRAYREGESIDSLCEDFQYVCVKRTITGMMCLACNEINIIEEKEYYDECTEESGKIADLIYPTKEMQKRYEENIKKIPPAIYSTYIRAREADSDNKDVALILFRKTIESMLKEMDIQGKNLQAKIANIQEKLRVVEEGMNQVRYAGNKAVHEYNIDFSDNEIQDIAEKVDTMIRLFYQI